MHTWAPTIPGAPDGRTHQLETTTDHAYTNATIAVEQPPGPGPVALTLICNFSSPTAHA
jgi:hypothetical protein